MGWRDAPVVSPNASTKKPAWASAPIVGSTSTAETPTTWGEAAMGAVQRVTNPLATLSEVPSMLVNVPESAANLVGGVVSAVRHPIETAKTVGLAAYGGARNVAEAALPKEAFDALKQLENPQIAQQAVDVANAIGGMYVERYGSPDKIRDTIIKDPVGALADLSTLLGGVGLAKAVPGLAKAGRAATIAADATNPLTIAAQAGKAVAAPVNKLAQKAAQAGAKIAVPTKAIEKVETAARRAMAGAKARTLADITAGEDVNALIAALETPSTFPRRAGEAAAKTQAAPYVALQERLASGAAQTEGAGKAGFQHGLRAKAAIEAPVKRLAGTEAERTAAIARRKAVTTPHYKMADISFAKDDAVFQELLGRPEVAAAAKVAANNARSQKVPTVVGETRAPSKEWTILREENGRPVYGYKTVPGSTAQYRGQYLADIRQGIKDQMGTDAHRNSILRRTLQDFDAWVEAKLPHAKVAKTLFQAYSELPNAQAIGKMLYDTLSPPTKRGTGELDFDAFARALADEPGVIAKALDWKGPAQKFAKYLSPDVIRSLKAIDNETINKNMTEALTQAGTGKAAKTVRELYADKGAHWLNKWYTLYHLIAKKVGASLSDKAIAEMTTEALNPKAAAKALREMQKKLPPKSAAQPPIVPSSVTAKAQTAKAKASTAAQAMKPIAQIAAKAGSKIKGHTPSRRKATTAAAAAAATNQDNWFLEDSNRKRYPYGNRNAMTR